MHRTASLLISSASLLLTAPLLTAQEAAAEAASIFNGKSLDGWDGDPRFWRVEDGCITGQTTAEAPTESNTFLIWKDGEVDDFELTAEYKLIGGNSGIQVRSFPIADANLKWRVGGYQADFEAGTTYSGIVYGEGYRGILANRGQRTVIGNDSKPVVKEQFAESAKLQEVIKSEDWNKIRVHASGWTVENYINDTLTASVTDEDTAHRRRGGLLALQLHAGPPMKVQFRNLKLKRLPMKDVKKVVFIAGRASHGAGEHEHRAGSKLLSNLINRDLSDKLYSTVYSQGWPNDGTAFQNADAIVMYSDGGGGHMVIPHLAEVEAANKRGVGVGAIHYAVEIPAGQGGKPFLDWMGGYFEENWSVNPHWNADFKQLPVHPVTRGVSPFKANDEWYYHMRFRPENKGVTPILSALPGPDTLSRPDGPHSGNPAVRESVAKGEVQHMMWTSDNANGSRGFGFTGAHYHKNWKEDNFRTVVVNAIGWIAKLEIPEGGLKTKSPGDDEMNAHLDAKGKR